MNQEREEVVRETLAAPRLGDVTVATFARLKTSGGPYEFTFFPFGEPFIVLLYFYARHLPGQRGRVVIGQFDLIQAGVEIRPDAPGRHGSTLLAVIRDATGESLLRAARFLCDPANLWVPPELADCRQLLKTVRAENMARKKEYLP